MACAFAPVHSSSYRIIHSTDSSLTRHNVIPSMEVVDYFGTTTQTLSFLNGLNDNILAMDQSAAEQLAGPFFGASLFPYLGFLFFLNVPQNETPKGVVVGFATCLLFVFLTIPAAIGAKVWYDVSLADCDWLHGSAESLLTITNLVTVVAFRQALSYKEQEKNSGDGDVNLNVPESVVSYDPMIKLVGLLTVLAFFTALVPAVNDAQVHTPYLVSVCIMYYYLLLSIYILDNHSSPLFSHHVYNIYNMLYTYTHLWQLPH